MYLPCWEPQSHRTMAIYHLGVKWTLASTHIFNPSAKELWSSPSSQTPRQRELSKSAYHLKYFTLEYFIIILSVVSSKSLMLSSQLATSQWVLSCSFSEEANVSWHWQQLRAQESFCVFTMSLLISLHKLMTASGAACRNKSSERVFFASCERILLIGRDKICSYCATFTTTPAGPHWKHEGATVVVLENNDWSHSRNKISHLLTKHFGIHGHDSFFSGNSSTKAVLKESADTIN